MSVLLAMHDVTKTFGANRALDGVSLVANVHRRDDLPIGAVVDGPAIVVQYDSTVVVPPDWRLTVDPSLSLIGESR